MSFEPKQIQMICLEDLVLENHIYRNFLNLWNMDSVRLELEKLEANSSYKGYGIFRIFCACCCSFLKIYPIVNSKDLSARMLLQDGSASLI